jgi:hypothetical protein
MKNYMKFIRGCGYVAATSLFLMTTSCNNDDAFGSNLREQEPTALINDVTLAVSTESVCQADVTVTSSEFARTIYYLFVPSSEDAPDSDTLYGSGLSLSPVDGVVSFTTGNLIPETDYTAYFVTVNNDGLRSENVTEYSYAVPEFDINVSPSYVGTSVFVPNGSTQENYEVTVTAVAGMENTFDINTSWGPDFVTTVCNGCVASGDYPGPVRFEINPETYEIIVLSGGEPSGQGYTFDLPYVISGSGSYDICANTISLNLNDETLFGESVTVFLQ